MVEVAFERWPSARSSSYSALTGKIWISEVACLIYALCSDVRSCTHGVSTRMIFALRQILQISLTWRKYLSWPFPINRQKVQPDIYLISSKKGCFGNGTLRSGHTELTAIERLSITFMSCRLLFMISTPKLEVWRNFFIHKNCFELFLSDHFLFWKKKSLNLNRTFPFCRIREALNSLMIRLSDRQAIQSGQTANYSSC